MKKLLSIVLAVALMATFAFSASAATYKESGSLLPDDASKFVTKKAGYSGDEGECVVTKEGDGFKFSAEKGWPTAAFAELDPETQTSWIQTNKDSGLYLNYDFEVKSGATKIIVYFCGQNPDDMASLGSMFCINAYEMPETKKADGDTDSDLGVGVYKKSVPLSDIGYGEHLLGNAGEMLITGFKVFAVGSNGAAEIIVNDISVGPKYGDAQENPEQDTTTTTAANGGDNTTKAPDNTTKAQSTDNTTQAPAATTTVAKTTAANNNSGDSAKTGDVSNAIVFIVVAAAAAGVVTLSVVSKKSKAR